MPTYPTAMRVCTLARLKMRNPVAKAIPPRQSPSLTMLALSPISCGAPRPAAATAFARCDIDALLEELAARSEQPPWRPRGRGWQLVGDLPPSHAKPRVWFKERWVPALGPAGDDVFDLDPRWRQ